MNSETGGYLISASKSLCRYLETTVGDVTALNSVPVHERATELADEASKSGKGILEIMRE
jgi:aspartate ammonia-lyase